MIVGNNHSYDPTVVFLKGKELRIAVIAWLKAKNWHYPLTILWTTCSDPKPIACNVGPDHIEPLECLSFKGKELSTIIEEYFKALTFSSNNQDFSILSNI